MWCVIGGLGGVTLISLLLQLFHKSIRIPYFMSLTLAASSGISVGIVTCFHMLAVKCNRNKYIYTKAGECTKTGDYLQGYAMLKTLRWPGVSKLEAAPIAEHLAAQALDAGDAITAKRLLNLAAYRWRSEMARDALAELK